MHFGAAAQTTYDAFGDLASVTNDPGTGHINQLTSFRYDVYGDIVSVTDPLRNVTTSTWDADRRQTSVTTPFVGSTGGSLVTSYTYDPDGRLLQTRQAVSGTVLRTTSTKPSPGSSKSIRPILTFSIDPE